MFKTFVVSLVQKRERDGRVPTMGATRQFIVLCSLFVSVATGIAIITR